MEFNCEYNGYTFTGIYQGDNTMLIKAGDEELCYVDLDNYDDWTFEDIIEDLCDDHYQNLKEIMFYEEKIKNDLLRGSDKE